MTAVKFNLSMMTMMSMSNDDRAVKFNLSMIIEEDVAGVDLDQLNMSLEQLVIPNIDK